MIKSRWMFALGIGIMMYTPTIAQEDGFVAFLIFVFGMLLLGFSIEKRKGDKPEYPSMVDGGDILDEN